MKPIKVISGIWLSWVIIVISFQAFAAARLLPQYPDRAQAWTEKFTGEGYQRGHVYLLEPFMNNQVAWDSEYYLSIAVGGYDDPRSPHLTSQGVVTSPDGFQAKEADGTTISGLSSNYAFFFFYPLLIRIFILPLQILGLNPIATATLAGVIVSALGALVGMLALFDLTRDSLGEAGGLRAVFYLIVFPTGFYLVQVYTEGLFVGLAFSCLVMLKRKQWILAAILAFAATFTRAVGVALVIPMLIAWFRSDEWLGMDLEWRRVYHEGIRLRPLVNLLFITSPLLVFLIWRYSNMGESFRIIQDQIYGRNGVQFDNAIYLWGAVLRSMLNGANPQYVAYYLTEFLGLGIGIVASILVLKTHPEIGWYSLAVVLLSWGSSPAQGMHRYVLGAPAVFITLARWGRDPVFDRAWTILSILLMGLLAMLFAFDMWVA